MRAFSFFPKLQKGNPLSVALAFATQQASVEELPQEAKV
jgi:hypothetical protein